MEAHNAISSQYPVNSAVLIRKCRVGEGPTGRHSGRWNFESLDGRRRCAIIRSVLDQHKSGHFDGFGEGGDQFLVARQWVDHTWYGKQGKADQQARGTD